MTYDWPDGQGNIITSRVDAHVEPFVRALGFERAVEFLIALGGSNIYVGKTPTSDNLVVRVFGAELLSELADNMMIGPYRVPNAKPFLATWLAGQGLSTGEIVRRVHSSDVAVRKWLRARRDFMVVGKRPEKETSQ